MTTSARTQTTAYGESPETRCRMTESIFWRSPLVVTAFPSAIPPMARKTTVQRN